MTRVSNPPGDVRIFATVPPPVGAGTGYRDVVRRAAQLSEDAGFCGALVYSDNRTVDPWAVAQELIAATRRLTPLIALQPVYAHPFAVAQKIASIGLLYDRHVYLNLVAGGNQTDLAALDDRTAHDARYARLVEYTRLIELLLAGGRPVTFDGDHYRVRGLAVFPALPERLRPELFISGSSDAGRRAGEQLGAVAVRYPMPPGADEDVPRGGGVRLGIIARDTDEQAWRVARDRFPASRAGQMLQRMARQVSDSQWLSQLGTAAEFPGGPGSPYWMGPFHNYASFCPYLVGSHENVAGEVARYLDAGCRTFIMDTARSEADYLDTRDLFARALIRSGATDRADPPAHTHSPAGSHASSRGVAAGASVE